ncbi:MAG: hypothetical protein QGF68_19120, partial [Nitrospinota bacterium]|nr:hypothetical protein [Nitrospinota bacterium]
VRNDSAQGPNLGQNTNPSEFFRNLLYTPSLHDTTIPPLHSFRLQTLWPSLSTLNTHQTVRKDLNAPKPMGLGDGVGKRLAGLFFLEYLLAGAPPVHYVIDCIRKLNPKGSRHKSGNSKGSKN